MWREIFSNTNMLFGKGRVEVLSHSFVDVITLMSPHMVVELGESCVKYADMKVEYVKEVIQPSNFLPSWMSYTSG